MEATYTYLALCFLLAVVFHLLLRSFTSNEKKKNLAPSPPSLPFIGHLHLCKKPLHHTLADLAARYGPIVSLRFGSRPVLLVSSSAAADECFTTHDITFANRPVIPSRRDFTYNNTTIGTASYGPGWRNLRRIATLEVLSSHRLRSTAGYRAEEAKAMIRDLFRDAAPAGSGKAKLRSSLFQLLLNLLMRTVSGKREYSEEELRKFRDAMEESFASIASNAGDFVPLLWWLDINGVRRRARRLFQLSDEFLQGLIDESKKKKTDSGEEKSMLADLLSSQKTDPDNYSELNIKALLVSLLSAGADTTTYTIEWAMTNLLSHPAEMARVRAEIDGVLGNRRLLEETDLADLPYLQCIVSETLRMYPPLPLLIPHLSSEDCTVGGFDVPRGTMLIVNAYAIQRDPAIWENPGSFSPERFEGGKGKWMAPFGMGRRKCPGEGMGTRAAAHVLGMLLQCFDWEKVEDGELDMAEAPGLTMPRAVPLEPIYRPRPCMLPLLSELL